MPHYKAVKLEGGKLVSTYAKHSFKVEYKVGEWTTKPVENPHFGLFTTTSYEGLSGVWGSLSYEDISESGLINRCGNHYEIYECEVVPLELENPMPYLFMECHDSYWNINKLRKSDYKEYRGTLVEKVKLVRKLSKDEILNLKRAYETLQSSSGY